MNTNKIVYFFISIVIFANQASAQTTTTPSPNPQCVSYVFETQETENI